MSHRTKVTRSPRKPRQRTDYADEWYDEEEAMIDNYNDPGPSRSKPSTPKRTIPPTPFRPTRTLARTPNRPPTDHYSSSDPGSPSTSSFPKSPSRPRIPPQYERAPMMNTIRILLGPFIVAFNILSSVLMTFLSPLLAHILNALIFFAICGAALYFLGPTMLGFVASVPAMILRGGWSLAQGRIPFSSSLDGMSWNVVGNATSGTSVICTVVPFLCSKRADGSFTFGNKEEEVNVNIAQVAKALSNEVRQARDIFDSVARLGHGGQDGGLYHTRIWELATAIKVASHLPDKDELAAQVAELGDLSRDLSDEVSRLSALNINAFSWVTYEFDRLTKLLATNPNPEKLTSLLHSLMSRLETNLEALFVATERAIPHADRASRLGGGLLEEMVGETRRLELEVGREPGWKRFSEKAVALAMGKSEPSKLEMLERDLDLSVNTVGNLRGIRNGLEETRSKLVDHRNHVGYFKAGVMGFHIGAKEGGLSAEEELDFLRDVVGDMKRAVKVSKGGGWDAEGDVEVGEGGMRRVEAVPAG